jgi:hypothetical protein
MVRALRQPGVTDDDAEEVRFFSRSRPESLREFP